MSTRITNIILFTIIAIMLIAGVLLYPNLPEQMASHWDLNGAVNGYMDKFWGVFLIPIIMVGLYLLYIIIPKIDPSQKSIESFRPVYNNFWIIFMIFMLYIFILQLLWNFDYLFNFVKALSPAFTLLWIGIAYLLKNSKRNWFVGIRTPWTLSSDKIWSDTHILGSKLFLISGLLMLLGIFIEASLYFMLLMLTVLISAFIPVLYSYLLFRKHGL